MGGVHIVVLQRDRHPGEQSVCDERSGLLLPHRAASSRRTPLTVVPALHCPQNSGNFTQQDAPQPLHCLGVELADACF